MVMRLLREGPSAGIRTVLTAARAMAGLQSLLALCDSRLILRMPNRQEHLLAGGDTRSYEAELPPGAGSWRGHRVQIACLGVDGAAADDRAHRGWEASEAGWRVPWDWRSGGFAVVATRSRSVAARLDAETVT